MDSKPSPKDINLKLVVVREAAKAGMTIPVVLLVLVLPYFTSFTIPNYSWVLLVSGIALANAIIFPFLHFYFYKKDQLERTKTLLTLEIPIDTATISLFLLLFPNMARPLFVIFGFIIIGASYTYNASLPYLVALIASIYVMVEVFLKIAAGEWLSVYEWLDQIMRLSFVVLMAYFSNVLAGSALAEKKEREKTQELTDELKVSEQKIKEQLVELNQRHKFVSLMRRLDQIIMNTLELSEMAQKIVDTVSWELGFAGGIIGVLSEKGEALNFLAISQTPEIKKLLISWDKPFSSLNLSLADPHYNIIEKALEQKRSITTDSLADIFHQVIPLSDAETMQKDLQVESLLVYPLSAKGKNIGVLVFLLHEPYSKLSAREIEILDAFSDQSGIALENALLLHQTKEAHEELQKSYARLEELDQMKDELVSISSHELRTPMTSVKSYLWMALNKANNLTPKLKKYLERAYASSDRMIKLVEDMLSVSRIDAGRFKLLVKSTDLESLIPLVVSELSIRAEEKEIDMVFVRSKKKLPKVLADKDKVQEVIINLLDNALKFTPQKGKIVISCRRRGKMVETSVTDTGPGIPKEDLPKLFQKFGRLEHSFATMAESGGGTGLGLYIAKKIINLHSGKIWVRSQKGKGSTFTFSLRIAEGRW